MFWIYGFMFSGLVCVIAQILLDNTNLTPGHVTSLFTVIGSILGFFNIYNKVIDCCKAGASTLIINFGAKLFEGAKLGYLNHGFIGIFTNMFAKSGAIIVSAIIFGYIFSLIFKPRN